MGHGEKGRQAFEERAWATAREELAEARAHGDADAADLQRLALASYLTGAEDEFLQAMEEAHHGYMNADEPRSAARCAFWTGLHLAERGEMARASGWFGRAGRILEEIDVDCAERGYLLLPRGQGQLGSGDYEACARTASEAEELGRRFGDDDLFTLALHLRGRALLRWGRVAEGLALLDEAMVSVVSDELSPQVTGIVFCSVISACREVWAVDRAQEWTAALTRWCEEQPDMVAYTGECRVYRAEVLQRRGSFHDALEEARDAAERLAGEPACGLAWYQQGEAHRVLGELAAAENAFREASRLGRDPYPGLALLRLAQGEADAAAAATRRTLAESTEPFRRARILPAHIEVMIDLGELEIAASACDELEEIARSWRSSVLSTITAQSRGAVELASGRPEVALPLLRRAWKEWQELDAPYAAARTRALMGRACRALGDEDGAELDLTAARGELESLEADVDVARLDTGAGEDNGRRKHGLTPREREVLAQLATGRTNRAIAEALFISEKTVARHVANIYRKLGLSSRSAATAYAYEHDLLDPPT